MHDVLVLYAIPEKRLHMYVKPFSGPYNKKNVDQCQSVGPTIVSLYCMNAGHHYILINIKQLRHFHGSVTACTVANIRECESCNVNDSRSKLVVLVTFQHGRYDRIGSWCADLFSSTESQK